ncbi:MAG: isoprenylcysteine carboxylmethyltransferase family protein, partial [Gemmatimonadota bacterium]|nr:isoprenylcysteine carboxylmethyltransferase family protein [Gemmatimonadota bacterium]
VAGIAILALAEVFNEWAVRTVGRTASRGLGGELVREGPYAFTRNPQYLAQSAMVVGLVVLADSTLLALLALPGIASLLLTPLAEESWLEERHGEAYRRYRERVPRFLGRRAGSGEG